MNSDRLSSAAFERVSGPAWTPLRELFLEVSRRLLEVSAETVGVLTTIYVKYQIKSAPSSDVYAVVWLKNSKQLVVGFSLPESVQPEGLVPAPKGMGYRGLTGYLVLVPGDNIPADFALWVEAAYLSVVARSVS